MEYRTSDTPLAAFLVTQGHLPSAIDYSNPPRYEIVFANSNDGIRSIAAQYNAGLAKVEPIAFNRILRKLNRILRNQVQWEDD
jgi:hypothetical protein